jgi:small-conductance mechanosensitive channel
MISILKKHGTSMIHKFIKSRRTLIVFFIVLLSGGPLFAQPVTDQRQKYPVTLDGDALFYIYNGIGVLSAEKRAGEITAELTSLSKNESLNYESITIAGQDDHLILKLGDEPIMAVTQTDAGIAGTDENTLAQNYRGIIVKKLEETRIEYNRAALIDNAKHSFIFLALLLIFYWATIKVFPWIYKKIERLDSLKNKIITIKGREILRISGLTKILIGFFKAARFVLSLLAAYFFIVKTLRLWPYTRKWELQPYVESFALLIFYSVLFIGAIKSVNNLTKTMIIKYESWKGTKFKSIRIQSVTLLSEERTVELITTLTKIVRLVFLVLLSYVYLAVSFSLFIVSKTWAHTLLGYFLSPLNKALSSLLDYLPNLFYITVLVFIFHYAINAVRFFFLEIGKGNIELPGFYGEWAVPTFKIVRFMILALGLIIIFPYLPGSNSPFFKGISIFFGILISFGSSSAIANIVAGIVLTYMRPYKIGDRVRIADTIGDVIEKTLLVTRVRTIKNVDITVPNSMVLGSHIINYSSSASDRGLILHTSVTIGYDAPWRQVHELLIAAASETEFILKEPRPFVLQTGLNDFYVSYEINAYTDEPSKMAQIYSMLHSKIQDKFNEAGVEIMSPHYAAMRDGNRVAIPQDHLPKEYQAPSFRIFGANLAGNKNKSTE